jgi:ERCC4-type nuclease
VKAHEETNMLESMVVLIDTREQPTDRAKKRYEALEAPYERRTLSYGDYTYNAQLPNGKWLFEDGETVSGYAVVERKMHLDELASCLTHSRERFEREFQRAKDHGARIFLLVENATWENLIAGRYRSKFNEKAFFASLCAWLVRYDLQLVFCKEETSGKIIKELLYRDLKQRIMDGFFDEHR